MHINLCYRLDVMVLIRVVISIFSPATGWRPLQGGGWMDGWMDVRMLFK